MRRMPPKSKLRWAQLFTDDNRRRAVAYTRVSTEMQGEAGLGMQAQKHDIERFAAANNYTVTDWFSEVKSGAGDEGFKLRPILKRAFDHALTTGATVIVSKVDRLTRDPDFMGTLICKQPVRFVAVQFGDATERMAFRIFSVVADEERRFISERTRAALQDCKRQGIVLGCPIGTIKNIAFKNDPHVRTQDERALIFSAKILQYRNTGMQHAEIASTLNEAGELTPKGALWTDKNVSKYLKRGEEAQRKILEVLEEDEDFGSELHIENDPEQPLVAKSDPALKDGFERTDVAGRNLITGSDSIAGSDLVTESHHPFIRANPSVGTDPAPKNGIITDPSQT